jgi:DNA-binding MarR family transcriptional regulator
MEDAPPAKRRSQAQIDVDLDQIGYRLEDHNAHLVRLVHQRATALFQEAFEGRNITPTQLAIMATLLRHGPLSQIALGRVTAIDTATLSTMLRRLQDMGLVERTASETDQRVNLVRLTPMGEEDTLQMLPLSLGVSEQLLAPLKPKDRERFIAALRLLA